jgi:hypothetical protein
MPSPNPSESHSLRGAVDRSALLTIRETVTAYEPLATATLDDFLNPETLQLRLSDGLGPADSGRIDVQWTVHGDYAFHYTDPTGMNCRWDKHPHGGDYSHVDDLAHFHPPPDAASTPEIVENSCITHPSAELVTRAVLKLWRAAYHADSYDPLNAGRNPP